jgi:hypothetical protein
MKKIKVLLFKFWNQIGISRKCSYALKNSIEYDKKQVIIDQLFFGLNTDESISLLKKVNNVFKERMENRRTEAISITNSISAYYAGV